jgi:Rrf2 family protein
MKIALQRKGDYAVRAVLDLARNHGQTRRKAREIAADMDIPGKYLPQVLAVLAHAGIVASVSGPDGGYELARHPRDVSLLEVVEAVEGEVRSSECILRGGPCRWETACAVHAAWSSAQDRFKAQLEATSFAELALVDAQLERESTSA